MKYVVKWATNIAFQVNDVWVPGPPPPATSFIVSLDCRDRLAISGNYSACKMVDFKKQLPICELRDPDDIALLSAYKGISGGIQVGILDGIDKVRKSFTSLK